MRVTFVISSMDMGGAEKVMALFANRFAGAEDEVTLLTFDDGRRPPFFPLDTKIKHKPLNLKTAPTNLFKGAINNFRRIKVLRKALRDSRPDVVISFLESVNVLTVLASRGLGLPVIISERDDPWKYPENKLWRLLRYLVYPFADRIVVHTDHCKAYFPRSVQPKIQPIVNPLMVPGSLKPKTDYAPRNVIITAGRLDHKKGFDVLIQAFALIREQHPSYRLVILGEGDERTSLEKLCAKLGVSSAVELPGAVKNVLEQMVAADFFVFSSRYEGFGNILCEAMACGLPVISTRTSGAEFILRSGQDGILVPIEDPKAMAQAMRDLIQNESKRRQWGLAALAASKRFSAEKTLQAWRQLIESTR